MSRRLRPGPRGRAWRRALAGALVAVLAAAAAAYAAGSSQPLVAAGARHSGRSHHSRRATRPAAVELTVGARAPMRAVPRSFLGLSTEYWSLPQWFQHMPALERVLSLIHPAGNGRMILRIGGDSADHSFWDPRGLRMPPWAFSIQPRELTQTTDLVRELGIRLIVDLNLITDSPATASQWAQAAEAGLPRGSILAFEIGNEPDIYSHADWMAITAGRPYLGRTVPYALTPRDYIRDFLTYARALRQVAPQARLAGPALALPVAHAPWVPALIAGAHRALSMVTIHRYPLSGCLHHPPSVAPSIGRLLSPQLATGMAAGLRPVIEAAHDAGLPVRLTELNSINCGGRAGMSNTFATALWAPDALFALLQAGIDGVNLHVRADTINAPFTLTPGGLGARPLLYGLILFARTLGPQARVVSSVTRERAGVNLRAYAVRTGTDGLHVLLIDKGTRPARVSLRLPATGGATVQRMLAPSARAESGVTLAGRWLGTDARWRGTPVSQVVAPHAGVYTVPLRYMSAALVSVRARPGTLGVPATGGRRSRAVGRALPAARFPRR
ncbi:MAG TPA: hypothetical protein VFN87_15640 [Solirubrobacteraceae bacterium]|nr:hypothetical protein [Solirubrobacteraceae bacterium]